MSRAHRLLAAILLAATPLTGAAQEQSVRPGINEGFRHPDVEAFVERFETESREVYARRDRILEACRIEPGQTVADIGAGTGLFTRMFAEAVGPEGRVIAVDIAEPFLEHIRDTSRQAGLRNVETVLATADSAKLPDNTVEVAFICDTYHHFEFPMKTMKSIYRALRPGGRVIVVDFRRVEGESSEWVLNHVRAGQEVVESEMAQAGLEKVAEHPELLEENYFVVFRKPHAGDGDRPAPR